MLQQQRPVQVTERIVVEQESELQKLPWNAQALTKRGRPRADRAVVLACRRRISSIAVTWNWMRSSRLPASCATVAAHASWPAQSRRFWALASASAALWTMKIPAKSRARCGDSRTLGINDASGLGNFSSYLTVRVASQR